MLQGERSECLLLTILGRSSCIGCQIWLVDGGCLGPAQGAAFDLTLESKEPQLSEAQTFELITVRLLVGHSRREEYHSTAFQTWGGSQGDFFVLSYHTLVAVANQGHVSVGMGRLAD